jgi:hypothetical protein
VDREAFAMTRIVGIVVGSLLMLGIFLLALGAGEAPTLLREVVHSEADTTPADTGMAAGKEVPVENSLETNLETGLDTGIDTPVLTVTDSTDPVARSQSAVEEKGFVLDPQLWNQAKEQQETINRDDAAAVLRYQVWSPFRSEWAANGFARRLVLATEVPVEVVNESPGNYQVVFSYRDDEERQARVERIEAVTGLELE